MKNVVLLFVFFIHSSVWAMTPIEQGIRLFNQQEYQQAQEILQQESDSGSAYATFWLGGGSIKIASIFRRVARFYRRQRWVTRGPWGC